MPRFVTQFGGLNTDVSPNHLPSGTADIALNVVVEKGDLKKRGGFASWGTTAAAVKGMWQVRFGSGVVYIVIKCADAKLYQRQVSPSLASGFTAITTEQTHNASDIGWAFMWYDRFHYFDRGGGSRWNPTKNSGKAYKAGMPRCATGATLAAAAGTTRNAGLQGKYRVVGTYRFSETEEEGQFSGPQATSVQCALNDPDDSSGLSISNWGTIKAHTDVAKYEIDQAHFYQSKGHTEYVPRGAGYEAYPHKYYDGAIVLISASTASVNKGDHIADVTSRATNAGGEPPASTVGCYTGVRAIYGNIYASSTLAPGKIMYSIPNYPTSVPQNYTYVVNGDSKTVEPDPWQGVSYIPFSPTEMLYAGGRVIAFTPTETWALASYSDGRIFAKRISDSTGCAAAGAACVAGNAIHAMGYNKWSIIGDGITELSHRRFRATLDDIGASSYGGVRMAYYSYEDQVWAAAGTTIYVWDRRAGVLGGDGRPAGALVTFTPAGIGTITAMCELSYSGQLPVMLVAAGTTIYEYPSGTSDAGGGFVAQWRGYFGQERINRDQKVERMNVLCGSNCDGNVTLKWRAMRTADETRDQYIKVLAKDNNWEGCMVQLGEWNANLYQVEFYSAAAVTAQWTIRGISWHLTADDVRGK